MCVCVQPGPEDCSNVWAVGVGLMSCSMTSVTPQDRLRETDRDKQEDRVTTSPWLQSAAGLLGRFRFKNTIGGLTSMDISSNKTSASVSKYPFGTKLVNYSNLDVCQVKTHCVCTIYGDALFVMHDLNVCVHVYTSDKILRY